jgi:hypothetical protein
VVRYRNVRHGSIVERHAADKWLEASAGWERITPVPVEELLDEDDLAVIAEVDNDESEDDR